MKALEFGCSVLSPTPVVEERFWEAGSEGCTHIASLGVQVLLSVLR